MSSPAAIGNDRLRTTHVARLAHDAGEFQAVDIALLGTLIILAALLRLAFFTGYFGSDEVTYVQSALAAAHGTWPNSSYIGAIRLGVNYPIAAAIILFGPTLEAVSLWGFLCSILEVGAVYWFALRYWGRSLAIVASFLLALVPLHVHLAGRIMADAPLALFITLTFVLFYGAEQRNSRALYVLAGASAGFVFWIKEAPIIFVGAFVVWALYRRQIAAGWLWAAASMSVAVAANFALLWALSGNPRLLFDAVSTSVGKHSSPNMAGSEFGFYLRYLFGDVWHTWLLGYMAAAGIAASIFIARRDSLRALPLAYLLLWGLGLLLIFSGFVISFAPLSLIPKQTNYMTIFLAPLCLLAGIAVLALRSVWLCTLVLGIYAVGALFLSALEQQNIHAFTANSRVSVEYAAQHPDTALFVMTNAYRLNTWAALVTDTGLKPVSNLHPIGQLLGATGEPQAAAPSPGNDERRAIVDMQTLGWADDGLRSAHDIPRCWQRLETLPKPVFRSAGSLFTAWSVSMTQFLPEWIARRMADKLGTLLVPPPAFAYRIPPDCS